jgi:hypothetical protein
MIRPTESHRVDQRLGTGLLQQGSKVPVAGCQDYFVQFRI